VAGRTAQAAAPPADPGITPRELAVLRLLADGLTAAAIGRRLTISPRTVHHHLERLYRKLGAGDRLAAVLNGQALGLLPGGAPWAGTSSAAEVVRGEPPAGTGQQAEAVPATGRRGVVPVQHGLRRPRDEVHHGVA
jgi:DNA-binding CsgD family transcriptional regulator